MGLMMSALSSLGHVCVSRERSEFVSINCDIVWLIINEQWTTLHLLDEKEKNADILVL